MGVYTKNRRIQSGSTGAVLPSGDSAVRPDAPEDGLIRYNTDSNAVEYFDGTQFVTLAAGATYSNANVAAYLPIYSGNIGSAGSYAGNFFANVFQGNLANVTDLRIGSATANGILFANAASYAITDTDLTWDGTVLTVTGNLSAGNILSNNYLYANGSPIDFQQPAGSTGQIQYNDNGNFGASSNFTFDSANVILSVGTAGNGNVTTGTITANAGNITTLTVNNVLSLSNAYVYFQDGVTATGNIETQANAVIGNTQILGAGNIILNTVNINGLATPVVSSDAATKGYVDGEISNTQALLGNIEIANTTITTDGTFANITITPTIAASGMLVINAVTGLVLPTGNTAQRPGNATAGTIRFNSASEITEVYTGTDWISVGNTFGTITTQVINGNSVANVFTLDQNATANSIIVVNNGVVQQPGVAYAVTGNTITFAEPPAVADTVTVRFISPVITINEITNDAGTNAISVDESGVGNLSTTQSVQLPSYTVAQTTGLGNAAAGQIIYVTNGDSGNACLAVYSGGAWKRVALGATIST